MSKKEDTGNGKDQITEATIAYRYAKDYRLVPANGSFGGITPRADIMIHFFEEYYPVPRVVVHEVSPEGKLGQEKARETESLITREIQVGVVLSPAQAESIAKWILDKVETLKKRLGDEK